MITCFPTNGPLFVVLSNAVTVNELIWEVCLNDGFVFETIDVVIEFESCSSVPVVDVLDVVCVSVEEIGVMFVISVVVTLFI